MHDFKLERYDNNEFRRTKLNLNYISGFTPSTIIKEGGGLSSLLPNSISTISDVDMKNIDSKFHLVLKKMNKKDSTTKCKALQEFIELCRDSEASSIESVLPFWTRIYGQLANDIEHKVRETTQLAHAVVVARVGKNIAVHLKQLAGPWFISLYDTYPPASSAALNSFNETFPQNKVVNAIVYCQDEILKYISENISSQASQVQSKQSSLSPEELEAKHQRLLVSSLQAYSFYLKTVHLVEIDKTVQIHQTILGKNSKYWKLANHESIPIKTGFFNVLASVIENAIGLLENEKKRAMTSIINSLDETDPGLLSAIWEAMLLAVTKIENWFEVVSIEKFVLPKLWRILKNGSLSCPTIMYPNLLPFLGQFPKFNLDSKVLFSNFFNNMREGFLTKMVKLTYSETSAIVTSFVECLRYAILINSSNQDICLILLKDQLMPVIEFVLRENVRYNKILFFEVSLLIRYWSKLSSECTTYFHLIDHFWIELNFIFEEISTSRDENFEEGSVSSIFNSQIDFLLALKNSPVQKSIKKVKFLDNSNTEVESKTENLIPEDDLQFLIKFKNFIHTLSVFYFKKINSESPKKHFQRFVKLVCNFETKELFLALSKSLKDDADLMSVYEALKSWLNGEPDEIQAGVQLVFILLKYIEESNQEKVLNSLLELNNNLVLKNALLIALSKENRNNKAIKSWCANFDIRLILKEVAECIINSESRDLEANKKMILLAFETTNDGVPLISNESIFTLASTLSSSLNKSENNSQSIANLISQILELTSSYKNLTDSSLISAICFMHEKLFEYSIQTDIKDKTIRSIWKRNISRVGQTIPNSRFLEVVKNLAKIFWKKMFESNSESENNSENNCAIEVATDFLESVIESSGYCETEKNKEIIKLFLTELDLRNWIKNFSAIVLYAEIVTGNLYKPCLAKSEDKKTEEIRIWEEFIFLDLNDKFEDYSENSLKWALFTTKLINNLLPRMHDDDQKEGSRSFESIALSNILEGFFKVIYVFTLGKIYEKYYKSAKHYTGAKSLLIQISKEFDTIHKKKFLTTDLREEIGNFFSNNVHDKILPHLLHIYHTEFEPDVTPSMYFKNDETILSGNDEDKRISYIRGVQILTQYFDDEKVLGNLQDASPEEALIIARSKLIETQNLKLIEVLDQVMKSPKGNLCFSLYDKVISEFDSDVSLALEVVNSFTKLVTIHPTKLMTHHWDFIMTSMVELQVSILQTITWCQTQELQFYPMQVSALVIAISNLYSSVQNLMNKHEETPIAELPPELLDEWKNVFLIHTQAGIAQIWINISRSLAEIYEKSTSSPTTLILLNTLGTAMKLLNGEIFCQKLEDESRINSLTLNEVILSSLKLMISPVPNLQLGGYHMLNHVIPQLIEQDKAAILDDNFDPKSLNLAKLEEILASAQNIVRSMLIDFKLCDTISCTIQPYTDSYTYTLEYLLTWCVILKMCAIAHGDLRYQYAEILKDKYFPSLMESIFKLMPAEVLQDTKAMTRKLFVLFRRAPSLEFSESWTEWRLEHIACWLYTNSLRFLPVLVRQWWSTTDSRVSTAVDKITSVHVSPMLCSEELQSNKFENIENMQVKVLPSAGEVIALYQMDETKLELSIVLPTNHPLGAVTITPCQFVGGTANWRNCHMQLSILLTHQNGSLWDGLMLWKKNLDKRFGGIEECCICYSVFHISTYQIPKSSCHTCRKKFHTSCLYKWFNTSQKSSCPICRNVF